ncbi:30S ribosomal protein S12 methylthiotransferase RimO [Pseudenhygromyxa sp. WMMC2535]|uniref:30S ribosomal protein S12 methylthiotransferase RimO n=1 Tax=Pseudenhygromyxa sp. WMMC2535 TaxID=2712867 RepID=UPI0015555963|nr:30S ribosomal protein S12 methylthiotransferase RimO [Pseudenhygromyxa sp. WMMC2535]NVB37853.1 30S ribosomal protein S12 methylthiotransferase RimO [Pseudenhygromyxa sp. WMMC2535]
MSLTLPVIGGRPSASSNVKKKVYFVSLGCPKNQVDTEVMLGVVEAGGHELVDDPEAADTLVVNTCGFIDAAKEESIETILELAAVKTGATRGEGSAAKQLVVTGCLSQRYPTQLADEMPEVDHFLGSADMLGLERVLAGAAPRLGVSELDRRAWLYDHATPRRTYGAGHSNFVKIAEGCDRPCGFCIIPKLRGPQRSRPVFDIVEEVHGLVEAGTREVCLVAQDLTTYGTDFAARGMAPSNLEGLLDALGEIPKLRWIRLHYAYPTAVTPGLISRIVEHPKVATYLDVPLQHVDTGVLKSMRRGYTEKVVRQLVEDLRAAEARAGSRLWLRTTMLVGHPGEDEAAYARLREFVGEGQIDHLGVFPWSREDGTVSAMQPKRVDTAVAEARATELMQMQAEIRARKFEEMIGEVIEVMVDGLSAESELLLDGRHEGQAPEIDGKVILCDGTAEPGEVHRVRVLDATDHDLVASFDLERMPGDELDGGDDDDLVPVDD